MLRLIAAPLFDPADAQVRVERDQRSVVEHRLEHRERSVDSALHDDRTCFEGARALELRGRGLKTGSIDHVLHAASGGTDGGLHEDREEVDHEELRAVANDSPPRLRKAEVGQRASRRGLVLDAQDRLEARYDGRGVQCVGLAGQQGDLLLGRQQHVDRLRMHDSARGGEPRERIEPERGHTMYPAHVTREPGQAERVGRDGVDLVALGCEDRGDLAGGQTRAVGEQGHARPRASRPGRRPPTIEPVSSVEIVDRNTAMAKPAAAASPARRPAPRTASGTISLTTTTTIRRPRSTG